MSGLATGAERVYLNEEGVTLADLVRDVCHLKDGFARGKRVGLVIRNEQANAVYDTDFMCALFEEEGGNLFDVRKAILGHLQQGGDPSPLDRIQASRLAARAIDLLDGCAQRGDAPAVFLGPVRGRVEVGNLEDWPRQVDLVRKRPREQGWLALREIARILSRPAPSSDLPC
jgi:6-phosphofructokinase 1